MIDGVRRLTGPLGPSDVDPDQVRDAACDVTQSDQVCNPPEPDLDDLPDLDPSNVPEPNPALGLFGQLLVLLLVVALVLAIAWLAYRWWQGRARAEGDDDLDDLDREEEVDEPVDARVIDHETPPDRWRRQAADHRDAGRFRDSIRCEYRALVGDLARAGFVDEIPGRTSGEERAQVASIAGTGGDEQRAVTEAFDVAADTFDAAWFDDAVVTREDDDRFLHAEEAVLGTVLSGTRSRARS